MKSKKVCIKHMFLRGEKRFKCRFDDRVECARIPCIEKEVFRNIKSGEKGKKINLFQYISLVLEDRYERQKT